jgi:hypothetical protein
MHLAYLSYVFTYALRLCHDQRRLLYGFTKNALTAPLYPDLPSTRGLHRIGAPVWPSEARVITARIIVVNAPIVRA